MWSDIKGSLLLFDNFSAIAFLDFRVSLDFKLRNTFQLYGTHNTNNDTKLMQQRTTADAAACSVLGWKISKIPRARESMETKAGAAMHTHIAVHAFRVCTCICARLVAHVCRTRISSCAGLNRWKGTRNRLQVDRTTTVSKSQEGFECPGSGIKPISCSTSRMLYHRAIVSSSPRAKKEMHRTY